MKNPCLGWTSSTTAWSRARLGAWSQVLAPGPWPMVRGPGPWSLAHGPWSMVPGPWSLVHGPWYMVHGTGGPSEARVFHQSGPYGSYGCIRTTIRRRISIRIILDRSRVKLKPSWHRKLKKSLKVFHQKYQNSERIGSRWLRRGPYPVRMKRTTSRNLSKPLRDPWEPNKIKKNQDFPGKSR